MTRGGVFQPFVAWWERFSRRPFVAHHVRAVERYVSRMGDPLGAAITYYSVLSLVPMLMFALAAAGMILTFLRPELLSQVEQWATLPIADPATKEQLSGILRKALFDWRGLGLVALLTAGFAGVGWVGGLKTAVRTQLRADLDEPAPERMFVLEVLNSLAIFVGLIVAVGLTFAVSGAATSLASLVLQVLGFPGDSIGATAWLRLFSLITSLATGWVLYMFLFRTLPLTPPQGRALWQGSLMGSLGLALLQYLTGMLIGIFTRNLSAAIFGPVIVLMLFFNLFARLTLYCAAWIGTDTSGTHGRLVGQSSQA